MVDKVGDVSLVSRVHRVDVFYVVQVKEVGGALAVVHVAPPLGLVCGDDLKGQKGHLASERHSLKKKVGFNICMWGQNAAVRLQTAAKTPQISRSQTFTHQVSGHVTGASYLSHVLHDERVLLDVLQRADAPPSTVVRPEDTQVELDSLLDHPVGTLRATSALRVALINGLPGPDADLALLVVSHAVERGPGAAAVDGLLPTAAALAADGHLVQHDAWTHLVVVDVCEVFGRALQVHLVPDKNAARVVASLVQMSLPAPQTQVEFSFLSQEGHRLRVQLFGNAASLLVL